jgi:hypothetical protein
MSRLSFDATMWRAVNPSCGLDADGQYWRGTAVQVRSGADGRGERSGSSDCVWMRQ